MEFIRIQKDIYRIDTIKAVTKGNRLDIIIMFDKGRMIFRYKSSKSRDDEYKKIENALINNRKCLHCESNELNYCERCYQKLISKNLALQIENKELEEKIKSILNYINEE